MANASLPSFLLMRSAPVYDDGAVLLVEADETRHLLPETIDVVLYGLARHHAAKIGASGGIADHRRAAADEDDGTVSRLLQTLGNDELHEMPHVQAVRRGIEPDVEALRTAVQQFFEVVFKDGLLDKTARSEFVYDVHLGHLSVRLSLF